MGIISYEVRGAHPRHVPHHGRRDVPVEQTLQVRLIRGRNHAIARAAGLAKERPRFVERQF